MVWVMKKVLLQKLSETTAEPNKVQTKKRKDALAHQASKRRFIEDMLQPEAGAKMKERHKEEVDKQKQELLKPGWMLNTVQTVRVQCSVFLVS